jgi:ATP-dependent helicase HrpA
MSHIHYPDLPIIAEKENIIRALKNHSVVVVAGETGSGKTTQLPKICLEAGLGSVKKIGHTQPRRLAARSVAFRIASELQTPIGTLVGYKVRFSDQTSDATRIQLMTDGILLSETQNDKWLSQYDCIIIDEAHERSLNIDFLLGYLKNLLRRRHDLKIIITSATIDVSKFSRFFNDAPLITVEGRSFPVEVNYLDDSHFESDDPALKIAETVKRACERGPGDILIFQSGEKEIRELAEVLHLQALPHVHILPLYARLSVKEQQKIFDSYSGRKIILATNVAETSITVPNIRFVIDPGFARVSRYNYRNKLQRLPIEPISQASAEQRKGRCGRVGPGICYRLYEQSDLLLRPAYTEPEILRVNLAGVILRMLDLGFRPVETFPLIDPLDPRYVKDGMSLLERLGAIDEHKKITPIGRQLAKIPLEPKFGRIMIGASQYGCLKEILVIVSALSIVDPREWPENGREKAQLVHAQFVDERSDFIFFLNLWKFLFEHKQSLSHNKFRLLCRQNYLSYLRVCEWFDVHQQLVESLEDLQFKQNQAPAEYSLIHRALLTGLLDTIGIKDEKKEYKGPRNIQFYIHPGSALFKSSPQWLMACEIVHTSKTFARTNAAIEPKWIEEVGGALLKRQHYDPHFDPKEGRVIAFEKLSIFGLELTHRRKISFEKIDSAEARTIFIREALCEEKMRQRFAFYEKNHNTLLDAKALECRIRKHQALVDEHALFMFYDKKLPRDLASVTSLEKWLKKQDPSALVFSMSDIVRSADLDLYDQLYPSVMTIQGAEFRLEYELDLRSPFDGVTLVVPIEALKNLKEEDFSWPVSGYCSDKIDFAIRSLPKKIRLLLGGSIPNVPHVGTFSYSLSAYLKKFKNIDVPKDDFEKMAYPAYLMMHFKIVEQNGEVIEKGQSLTELYEGLKGKYDTVFATGHTLEQSDLLQWNFGDLPLSVDVAKGSYVFTNYPALALQNQRVSIGLFESQVLANYHHPIAMTHLVLFHLAEPVKFFTKSTFLKQKKHIAKLFSPFGTADELLDEFFFSVAYQVIVKDNPQCRSQSEFLTHLEKHRVAFLNTANKLWSEVIKILEDFALLQDKLYKIEKEKRSSFLVITKDIDLQLTSLFPKHFIRRTPMEWLLRYSAYLKAIMIRLEKYPTRVTRDDQLSQEIHSVLKAYHAKLRAADLTCRDRYDPLLLFCYQVEELRVSLFAESLKTLGSVSKIRLLKLLEKLS